MQNSACGNYKCFIIITDITLLPNVVRCTNGDVRLVGGNVPFNGVVEICYDEAFGSICDSGFGLPEATIVCYQLGYSRMGK